MNKISKKFIPIMLLISMILTFSSPMVVNASPPAPVGSFDGDFTNAWKGMVYDAYDGNINNINVAQDLADMAAAGTKWLRFWFNAPTMSGSVVNFANADKLVELCEQYGINIVACYMKGTPSNDLGTPEQIATQTEIFRQTVERYKDKIKYFEIQNEPNLTSYWNADPNRWDGDNNMERGRGSSDPDSVYNAACRRYVQWLEICYNTAKAVDPSTTIIMGGVSEWIMEDFMDRMTYEHAYLYCDDVAFHPYVNRASAIQGPPGVIVRLKQFQAKIAGWPAPYNDKPIWITEIGFHVDESGLNAGLIPNRNGELDEYGKGQHVYETMALLMQNLPHPRPLCWYVYREKGTRTYNGVSLTSTGYALVQTPTAGGTNVLKTNIYLPAYYAYKALDLSWDKYASGDYPAYKKLFPFGDEVASVSVNGPASVVSGPGATASYTISIEDMLGVNAVELEFEVDGDYLASKDFVALNGFTLINLGNYGTPIFWKQEANKWIGKATLICGPGASGDLDILRIDFNVQEGVLGDAGFKLNYIVLSYAGTPVDSIIANDTATTSFLKYYSPYDLNKDEVIDIHDLSFAVIYLTVQVGDPDWEEAKVCDFNGDGHIDINDLIEIMANYTVPYYS